MSEQEITVGWWWVSDNAGGATIVLVVPWPHGWDFLNAHGDALAVLVVGEEVPQRISDHKFISKIERP